MGLERKRRIVAVDFSQKTNEGLQRLSKLIDGKCLRDYGKYILVKPGVAAVTNGYWLAALYSDDFKEEMVLNKDLGVPLQRVRIPGFENVIPMPFAKGMRVDAQRLIALQR